MWWSLQCDYNQNLSVLNVFLVFFEIFVIVITILSGLLWLLAMYKTSLLDISTKIYMVNQCVAAFIYLTIRYVLFLSKI